MSEILLNPNDEIIFNKKQDVTKLLKYCHLKREHIPINRKSAFRPIAEIPHIVYYRAVREGRANDSDAWKKWYRDPDNKYFKTSNARI